MSENCTHNCETCGESCPSREGGFPKEQLKEGCSVKKVIGIVSGKGGVGKSMVTSLLSVILNRRGYHTCLLYTSGVITSALQRNSLLTA